VTRPILATGRIVSHLLCQLGDGGTIWTGLGSIAYLERTIVSFGLVGHGIDCGSTGAAKLACCDLFGNAGGDWIGCIAGQRSDNGDISEDPLFCKGPSQDLTLRADSPCAAENDPECGPIGAWSIGCEAPLPIETIRWGTIRATFQGSMR